MAETTTISWCDRTWSPWYGCTQVSMGPQGACEGCYARHLSETRMGRVVFGGPGRGIGTRDARADEAWKDPIRWNRTSPGDFVFPSMCDPFDNHPDLFELRARFFNLIADTPNLTWLLLTKRPQNIVKLWDAVRDLTGLDFWPRNAAVGCTVVTQAEAERDIPHLLMAKAELNPAFAFLSVEPMLGPINLRSLDYRHGSMLPKAMRANDEDRGILNALEGRSTWPACHYMAPTIIEQHHIVDGRHLIEQGQAVALDWVIAGGETDQGKHKARPSHPDWFRSLRDQCAAAGVAFHHKQNGEWQAFAETPPHDLFARLDAKGGVTVAWPDGHIGGGVAAHSGGRGTLLLKTGKDVAGRLLDGALHDGRPEVRHG
jgi:protein gp37